MTWVIDASVAVRWFLEEESHPHAQAVLRRMIDRPGLFAVPELFPFEVYAVLCRIHPRGPDVFINGLMPILNNGIFRQPMTETLARYATRYVKKGLTGYDACYAALASELKGTWLTFDQSAHKLIKADNISHDLTESLPENWG